jgi:hypothetical protein
MFCHVVWHILTDISEELPPSSGPSKSLLLVLAHLFCLPSLHSSSLSHQLTQGSALSNMLLCLTQHFCVTLTALMIKAQTPSKCLSPSTRLHGKAPQKTAIFITCDICPVLCIFIRCKALKKLFLKNTCIKFVSYICICTYTHTHIYTHTYNFTAVTISLPPSKSVILTSKS